MPHQKRVLITGLALLPLLALGASVECRADGMGIETPPAASAAQKKTFLCAWHLSTCVAAVRTSQTTVHNAIRQDRNENGSSRLALDASVANVSGQPSDNPLSGGGVNFTVASVGTETDTGKGRWALNMMLDSNYHGPIFNNEAPFEAMQVSLNYIHAW